MSSLGRNLMTATFAAAYAAGSAAAQMLPPLPVPRRVRGVVGSRVAFDTRRALYVWERPAYPQFSIPVQDLADAASADSPEAIGMT